MRNWLLGGKRHELSAEDHVFASIMLYLDVVYIFMYILMLVGKRDQWIVCNIDEKKVLSVVINNECCLVT